MRANRTELLSMEVRCDPAAPAAVRGTMTSLRGLGWALGDAMLVASELVTAIVSRTELGSHGWLDVRVSRTPEVIVVAVRDPAAGPADVHQAALAGLGRLIVEQLSRSWGVDDTDGVTLWAEVPLGEASRRGPPA